MILFFATQPGSAVQSATLTEIGISHRLVSYMWVKDKKPGVFATYVKTGLFDDTRTVEQQINRRIMATRNAPNKVREIGLIRRLEEYETYSE